MRTRREFFALPALGAATAACGDSAVLDGLLGEWSKLWLPRKKRSLSEWAEEHFQLSPEYSAVTGQLRLFGWQREVFDSFTDPRVQKIVLKVGTQLVKTLFIQAALAYVMSEAPGPILLSQPKDPDAETFSKERLAPMLRDNPCLRGKVPDGRSPLNTITYKQFPGGSLTLVGALVPGNAARRSIQYFFADEINKYPRSVGNEGSFLKLGEERVVTYQSRAKIIYACSPTEPWAAISREYEASDQRVPYAPCQYCEYPQTLKWSQVWWSKDVPVEQRPETARYVCENCKRHWNDNDRWRSAEMASWKAQRPFSGTAGFWISHLYSPHKKLSQPVKQWLDADASKDTNDLRVFINTTLAEDWQERGEAPDDEMIYRRREGYEIGVVPQRGLFLTAFVDVQDEELHFELKAWGRGKENWSVLYHVIRCQTKDGHPIKTSSPEPWAVLAELLANDWPHESGATMPIMAMGIDTGFRPNSVYEFAAKNPRPVHNDATGTRITAVRTVVPTKGNDDHLKLISSVTKTDAARQRGGLRIWHIGTGRAKQEFYDALRQPVPEKDDDPQPGRCHYPYPEREFYRQVCSESRIVRANGKVQWVKDPGVRNEPVDTHVGNRAMANLCGIDGHISEEEWAQLENQYKPNISIEQTEDPTHEEQSDGDPDKERRGWFSSSKNWF